ncbi:MAG: choice-of-anchor R domain-containing protein [Planctomycetota bacterium]
MASIKFDNTEILSTTYMPQFGKHESAPDRTLMSMPLAREDGEVLIYERYGKKIIPLRGVLVGSSQSDLETKIDAFKELFGRVEKNLDFSWEAGTRRYVATCSRHNFDRDFFHLSVVPWTAEFTVSTGEGSDTGTTTAVSETVNFVPPSDATTGLSTVTFAGSKAPRPSIALSNLDFSTFIKGLEYKNTDTGERLVVTYPGNWGDNRTATIDCDAKTVTGDAVDGVTKALNFYGMFPKFKVGANNIQITCGGIVNQKSADNAVADLNSTLQLMDSTTREYAQSFMVPYTDQTFQGIQLAIKKTGAPGNITWRIETDNAGAPSGTLVSADATATIAAADVTTSTSYIRDYTNSAAPFTLSANTRYWLVVKGAATLDATNKWEFGTAADATYARGYAKFSTDTGATWTSFADKTDLSFGILFGGAQGATVAVNHVVTYTKKYL